MGAKRVVLDSTSPVVVAQRGTVLLGTNAVHPMIVVGEASARPTEYGNFQGFQGLEDVLTIAVDIGNLGVLTYPKSTIDTRAEMLRELSVDFTIDFGTSLVGMNGSLHGVSSYCL